jgi:hypothetical protein
LVSCEEIKTSNFIVLFIEKGQYVVNLAIFLGANTHRHSLLFFNIARRFRFDFDPAFRSDVALKGESLQGNNLVIIADDQAVQIKAIAEGVDRFEDDFIVLGVIGEERIGFGDCGAGEDCFVGGLWVGR